MTQSQNLVNVVTRVGGRFVALEVLQDNIRRLESDLRTAMSLHQKRRTTATSEYAALVSSELRAANAAYDTAAAVRAH